MLMELIEPYDPSKFSFHQFVTDKTDIKFLQKISKVAKKVTIGKINYYRLELDREFPLWKNKYGTEHLIIDFLEISITLVFKVFNNIKHLELRDLDYVFESIIKIRLPFLEFLKIWYSSHLNYFTGLKSLKHIKVNKWNGIINI